MAVEQPRRRRRVAPPETTDQRDGNGVPIDKPRTPAQSAPSTNEAAIDGQGGAVEDDMRPRMHPEMRTETSMERADRLAQEIFEHEHELGDTEDKFPMPPGGPPDGFHYEWKRHTVYGAQNPAYTVALASSGWRPVPSSRHPQFMPTVGTYETIEREGLILMEIPLSVYKHREARDLKRAKEQVSIKQAQLTRPAGPGQFERSNKGQSMVDIKRGYEPLAIPPSSAKG
jgi:hypothetical protein